LAEAINRDQRQLLGRHLMQRRALYARALKTSDVRTALNVLRDEATLEGLYPSAQKGSSIEERLGLPRPPINREERFRRTLAAEAANDKKELRLMAHLAPQRTYQLPDTMLPRMMLNLLTLVHVADQLDRAGMVFMALFQAARDGDQEGHWDFIGECHAYRFKVETDGWELFADELGVDGQALIEENHQGILLELFTDQIYEVAPTEEEIMERVAQYGDDPAQLPTAERLGRQWRRLLRKVLKD
jgi:hypothetical protein